MKSGKTNGGKAKGAGKAAASARRGAVTRKTGEILWIQYPGHFDRALSKALASPETTGSRFLDYRISSYEPGAHVERHVHRIQEQVYHVLSGEGVLILDGEPKHVQANDVTFIPPGVVHEFHCTGTENLVFLVITSPPSDDAFPQA